MAAAASESKNLGKVLTLEEFPLQAARGFNFRCLISVDVFFA